eukprot:Amastigsp_a180390_14.p2 type:complete len:112 gc:universal Amastigsp_a180390_14:1-336(+)
MGTEGRAQMQFDLSTVTGALRRVTSLHPLPGEIKAQTYIGAFYLQQDEDLVQWVTEHSEYSSKQLSVVITAAAAVSKKARQRAQEIVDTRDPKSKKRSYMPSIPGFGLGRG